MDLVTSGIRLYPDYHFPLWYSSRETFAPDLGAGTRLRLALVERGAGLLRVGERRMAFVAPLLACLNEQEAPHLEQGLDLNARALYFHPGIINSAFDFESIRAAGGNDSLPYSQDRSSLRAFLARGDNRNGLLQMGPSTAARASQLFDAAGRQLLDQPDEYWVCRSRSFLLELLSLSERLAMTSGCPEADTSAAAEATQPDVLTGTAPAAPGSPGMIPQIILYLHAHYQEKITIPELTRAFHTNRTTLAEQFRRETGMSIMTYLAFLRMRQASLLLRDTVLPVTEIMERVGYQDSANFWRTFRKHIGYSPSDYRQRYCWLTRSQ